MSPTARTEAWSMTVSPIATPRRRKSSARSARECMTAAYIASTSPGGRPAGSLPPYPLDPPWVYCLPHVRVDVRLHIRLPDTSPPADVRGRGSAHARVRDWRQHGDFQHHQDRRPEPTAI